MIHLGFTNVTTGVLAISGKALAGYFGFERLRFYAFAAETACASV